MAQCTSKWWKEHSRDVDWWAEPSAEPQLAHRPNAEVVDLDRSEQEELQTWPATYSNRNNPTVGDKTVSLGDDGEAMDSVEFVQSDWTWVEIHSKPREWRPSHGMKGTLMLKQAEDRIQFTDSFVPLSASPFSYCCSCPLVLSMVLEHVLSVSAVLRLSWEKADCPREVDVIDRRWFRVSRW